MRFRPRGDAVGPKLAAVTILRERKVWRREKRAKPGRPRIALTPAEMERVQRALRVLRIRYRTWPAVAHAIGDDGHFLRRAVMRGGRPSVRLALGVARALDVPLEGLLSGKVCPMCGRVLG